MIVGLLKNRTQVSIFSIAIICIGLLVYNFAIPPSFFEVYNTNDNLLYGLIFHDFAFSSFTYKLFNFILVIIGSVFLAFVINKNEIVSKENFLPTFFYIIFSYSSVTSNQLQPILIANLFIIMSLYYIYNSYRTDNALSDLFNVGFLFSLASCFYTYYIFIIPLGIISLYILKSFNWREWLCYLFGVFAPLYLFMSVAYLFGSDYLKPFYLFSEALKHINTPIFSEYFLVMILSSGFLILLAMFKYIVNGLGSRVKIQKARYILIWLTVLCLIISFFNTASSMFLLPCIIPFSIIIGDYVGEIKQLKLANTLMTIFIVGFLIICFHNLNFI